MHSVNRICLLASPRDQARTKQKEKETSGMSGGQTDYWWTVQSSNPGSKKYKDLFFKAICLKHYGEEQMWLLIRDEGKHSISPTK